MVGVELPPAVLLVQGSGVWRAPQADHRSSLLPPVETQTVLHRAATPLPLRRSVQVRRAACRRDRPPEADVFTAASSPDSMNTRAAARTPPL